MSPSSAPDHSFTITVQTLGLQSAFPKGKFPSLKAIVLPVSNVPHCLSPDAPPVGWILKSPCALPVSCPDASRLANQGLSLHGLVRVKPFSSAKAIQTHGHAGTNVESCMKRRIGNGIFLVTAHLGEEGTRSLAQEVNVCGNLWDDIGNNEQP